MKFALNKNHRLFVAGHRGMVGSALIRCLNRYGYKNIFVRSRQECDLTDYPSVVKLFSRQKPEVIILAAAKVGGIQANIEQPFEFLADNFIIAANIIRASIINNAQKIVMLGSSCIYPRQCPQPMKEDYLLTGPLEPTNEGYALSKIAGIRLAQYAFSQYGLSCLNPIPCNLYGPNDSFDPRYSHVISALVRKFINAQKRKEPKVMIWGTGKARRELMHVDDCAAAIVFLLEHYDSPQIINVGWGTDYSIHRIAEIISQKVGFNGTIDWDKGKPDGMPRKCLDVTRLSNLGFQPRIDFQKGVEDVIRQYRQTFND